nr:hypothetical protein CFP56_31727 [Quercus suber]
MGTVMLRASLFFNDAVYSIERFAPPSSHASTGLEASRRGADERLSACFWLAREKSGTCVKVIYATTLDVCGVVCDSREVVFGSDIFNSRITEMGLLSPSRY